MLVWPKRLRLLSAVHRRHERPARDVAERGRDPQSGQLQESVHRLVSKSKPLHLPRPRSAWLVPALTAELSHKATGQNPLWRCVERHSAYCSTLAYPPTPLGPVRTALYPVLPQKSFPLLVLDRHLLFFFPPPLPFPPFHGAGAP